VIVRANPLIEIVEDGQVLQTFGQESQVMILPGNGYNLSLLYDTSNLLPGDYDYQAKFKYNDIETEYVTGEFKVTEIEEFEDSLSQKVGENLEFDLRLDNPEGGLTFYKIEYDIAGKGVEGFVEGQIQTESKTVQLSVPTEGLAAGSYVLDLLIKQGRNLEKEETKTLSLKIEGEKSLTIWFLIPIGVLIGFMLYLVLPRLLRRPDIEGEVVSLQVKYDKLEKDAAGFSNDINRFIQDSNAWLESKGLDYGFR